jgi:hypothetical protein
MGNSVTAVPILPMARMTSKNVPRDRRVAAYDATMAKAMQVGFRTVDGVRVRFAESTGPSAPSILLTSPGREGRCLRADLADRDVISSRRR